MQSLTLAHMSKTYGGMPALSDVSLTLSAGRVHALMGENGAGKSTLIKLLAGVTQADRLEVTKDGQHVSLHSAQDAHSAGFRFIHQELNTVPQVTVTENILLGRALPRRFGWAVDWAAAHKMAQRALDLLGATHIDTRALAGDLSAGDKMMMKIAAALVSDGANSASLYVLDEPTAALSGTESEQLFAVISQLTARGAAVLYVSHRMEEVMQICDDVTVLRDGRHILTSTIAETSKDQIIHAMTGREVSDSYPPRRSAIADHPMVIADNARSGRLSNLNFCVSAGEILGIAGLADAGQAQLLRLFLGLEPITSGTLTLQGAALPTSPAQAWAQNIAFVPRERRSEALMPDLSIRDNIVLPHLRSHGVRARRSLETRTAQQMATQVHLKCTGLTQPVGELSGGNQQKVVFARALAGAPDLLLLEDPTRGVDVGAKYEIYQLVRELSAQGCAVILTSSDLPEILGMCDRILVLQDGWQSDLLPSKGLTPADLLARMYRAPQNEGAAA